MNLRLDLKELLGGMKYFEVRKFEDTPNRNHYNQPFAKKPKFAVIHGSVGEMFRVLNTFTANKSDGRVSAHFVITKKESTTIRLQNGQVVNLTVKPGILVQVVPENYIAWHAGFSRWKSAENLNQHSIGIELVNMPIPDLWDGFYYDKYDPEQLQTLVTLLSVLMFKYKISPENILGHGDISPNRAVVPWASFPWEYLSKLHIGMWLTPEEVFLAKKQDLKPSKEKLLDYLKVIGFGYTSLAPEKVITAFRTHFWPLLTEQRDLNKVTEAINNPEVAQNDMAIAYALAAKYASTWHKFLLKCKLI